jgi:hypothetical protein
MATMTRSKSQVIRGFLPGQTFQHANDTIVRVSSLYAGPADVNTELLVEMLDERLAHWQRPGEGGGPPVNRAPGYLKPVSNHADQYAFLEPEGEVFYYTWPLTLRCTNRACQKAAVFERLEDWTAYKGNPAKCDKCGSRREQYDYMLVHTCGNDAPMPVWPCKVKDASGHEHGLKDVYLNDTGSFITSTWRCRHGSCNDRVISRMRQPPCRCGEGPYQYVLVRQERRFITQTFSFVSFARGPMVQLRAAAGAGKVVVGSYLEYFTDYEKALGDAGKDRGDAEAKWRTMRAALEATGTKPEEIAEMRKLVLGESGDAFDEVISLVGDENVVAELGSSQRAAERTLIWGGAGGLRTWRLETFRQAALQGGPARRGAVSVLNAAEAKLKQVGFSDLLVVENFPVALVAYGFTRLGRDPQQVMLRAFPSPKKGKYRDKTPVYLSPTKTEAVFFELDAERVLRWLADNNRVAMPDLPSGGSTEADLVRRRTAKAHMLRLYRNDPDVGVLVYKLQHTIAHALIRNLGERSGFSEETMAEYLIPELLTIGLYADTHQEFTLGALVSLVEHRLGEWLDATLDGADTCAWDPQCGQQDGACAACLHLAFGCTSFNADLDRAVLFGTPPGHEPVLDIARGYWT